MRTGNITSNPGFRAIAIVVFALFLGGPAMFGQGYDPRWRSNDGWGNDRYGRDRDDGRWDRDDDWNRNGNWDRDGRWNRGGGWGRGYALDSRFRVREGDYRGRNGGRFEFRGRIDDEVYFFIRGGRVTVQNRAGRGMLVERWSLDDPFPVGRRVRLDVDRKDGRGRVQLVEEPNPRNNYTAVVRVYDPSGGADRYHFRLEWRH
jgi:hypothetical protein